MAHRPGLVVALGLGLVAANVHTEVRLVTRGVVKLQGWRSAISRWTSGHLGADPQPCPAPRIGVNRRVWWLYELVVPRCVPMAFRLTRQTRYRRQGSTDSWIEVEG